MFVIYVFIDTQWSTIVRITDENVNTITFIVVLKIISYNRNRENIKISVLKTKKYKFFFCIIFNISESYCFYFGLQ